MIAKMFPVMRRGWRKRTLIARAIERRQTVEHRDPTARLGVREVETTRTGSREDDTEHREEHDGDRDGGDQRWQRSAELPRAFDHDYLPTPRVSEELISRALSH